MCNRTSAVRLETQREREGERRNDDVDEPALAVSLLCNLCDMIVGKCILPLSYLLFLPKLQVILTFSSPCVCFFCMSVKVESHCRKFVNVTVYIKVGRVYGNEPG